MASETTTAAGGTASSGTERGPEGGGRPGGAGPCNDVRLVGRVPAAPEERELPSGDRLVTWRVVVERGPGRPAPPGVRAPTVDTLDCVAWTAPLRRVARGLLPGDVVEVRGALRRRFWRAGAGAASRCEVEATHVRRLNRRPTRG